MRNLGNIPDQRVKSLLVESTEIYEPSGVWTGSTANGRQRLPVPCVMLVGWRDVGCIFQVFTWKRLRFLAWDLPGCLWRQGQLWAGRQLVAGPSGHGTARQAAGRASSKPGWWLRSTFSRKEKEEVGSKPQGACNAP